MTKEQSRLYKTGEFLRRSGISRQTLYTYLTMGLIEEARRTETGRHLFDDKALKRVRIIKELNATGYPLRAIKEIYFKNR
ncbi:MAG: MerR family transcriptional regulator [Planctomycetota bacterium]|jgi:DNA-binding transcriptional MerR regulator